jgi:alanyl-tRNA synthetase
MTTSPIHGPTSAEIVARYLEFFRARGHLEIPGGPLVVPESTTSFIIAGMQPLLPYLRGEQTPPSPRLTDLQRCLRTDDVDGVGLNARKLTCFHMLGNWSIGDYGKREAIARALELLDDLGIDRGSLVMTTFAGDADLGLPPDEETIGLWHEVAIPNDHIVPLGAEDNFWTIGGGPGPCGPCTELYVDRGAHLGRCVPACRPGCACDRYLEIWNLVFIEYERLPDLTHRPLPLRSVDTGMGLERTAAVLQDVPSVFETDLFAGAQTRLAELAPPGVASGGAVPDGLVHGDLTPDALREPRARRMIVDHARAVLLAGLSGVVPGPDGRGSVLRRLIRRAARQGHVLGIERPFLRELLPPLVAAHGPLLTADERARVAALGDLVAEEEARFSRVLTAGLRELGRLRPGPDGLVPGARIFALHAARGFPADLAGEILAERGLTVDWPGYERALEEHRVVSRASVETRFRGG